MKNVVLGLVPVLVVALCAFTPQPPPLCECADNGAGWTINPPCNNDPDRAITDNATCQGQSASSCAIAGSFTVTLGACDQCVRTMAVEQSVGSGTPTYSNSGGTVGIAQFPITCANNLSFAAADFYTVAGSPQCAGTNIASWVHSFHCDDA